MIVGGLNGESEGRERVGGDERLEEGEITAP